MEWFVWGGAALTVAGLIGLGYVVMAANRARKEGLEGDAMHARLRSLVPLNLGALLLSALGLMCVILGVFLS